MRKIVIPGIGLMLALTVIIPAGFLPAGETKVKARAVKSASETDQNRPVSVKDVEQFDRNIRVDFKMVPADDNNKGTYVVTATPAFATSTFYRSDEGSLEFEASGEIRPRYDGKIFLLFEATAVAEGKMGEAELYAYSGVLLEPGKKFKAARMGDKELEITVSYLEEAKAQ